VLFRVSNTINPWMKTLVAALQEISRKSGITTDLEALRSLYTRAVSLCARI